MFPLYNFRPIEQGQYPWLVSVTVGQSHVCNGVLLSRRHVLTSATCVNHVSQSRLRVTIMEYNLNVEEAHQQSINVKHTVTHPQYTQGDPPSYNVAVLTLSTRVTHVSPVCWGPLMPSTDPDPQYTYTSWGQTQFGQSAIPHRTYLHKIDHSQCLVNI